MAIKLTEKARKELDAIMQKEVEANNLPAGAAVRVGVAGGGCSGFSYQMRFEDTIRDDDKVFDVEGIKVVVDSKSFLYLDETEIDFHDGVLERGFVFNNPNASGSCGCGQSFSV